jgi:DNA-binding MarR family transcriptional regulator
MEGAPDPGRTGTGWACPTAAGRDPITLVGLVFETASGLRHALGASLLDELGSGGQSFEILVRLGRSDGGRLRMADLAAQTGLTPSGLTRAVDRLVVAGLVERGSCPQDRRGAYAILTSLGVERTAAALQRHERDIAEILDGTLEPEEERELVELLRRLRDRVNPHAGLVGEPAPPAAGDGSVPAGETSTGLA